MFTLEVGKIYQKQTESRDIIRFQDCDPLQHLNNAKYFDYYFNGREDQVAMLYNFKYAEIFKQFKTIWVVYQHQIAYLRPAMVNEWIRIFSRIIHHTEDTIMTEFYMTDDNVTELKNVLITTSKYIDVNTGKRTKHYPFVSDFLDATSHANIPIEEYDFNKRIRTIKQEILRRESSL